MEYSDSWSFCWSLCTLVCTCLETSKLLSKFGNKHPMLPKSSQHNANYGIECAGRGLTHLNTVMLVLFICLTNQPLYLIIAA